VALSRFATVYRDLCEYYDIGKAVPDGVQPVKESEIILTELNVDNKLR